MLSKKDPAGRKYMRGPSGIQATSRNGRKKMDKHWACFLAFLFTLLSGHSAMALSAEQVLALKKAGVGEQTIQLMIHQEMAAKASPQDNQGVREIKDNDGNIVTIYSTGARLSHLDAAEQEKVNRAWKMLQNIIIDGRK
jgi:hypothetical protein